MTSLYSIRWGVFGVGLFASLSGLAQAPVALKTQIDKAAASVESKVVGWRRDLHQNPELGNRETRTAGKIAAHLHALGIEVQTGVAKTGVVGILKGGKPGPVVALRADMSKQSLTTSKPVSCTPAGTIRTWLC